jgi:hypothetical protein
MGDMDSSGGGPLQRTVSEAASNLEKAIFTAGFVVGSGLTLVGLLIIGLTLALLGII